MVSEGQRGKEAEGETKVRDLQEVEHVFLAELGVRSSHYYKQRPLCPLGVWNGDHGSLQNLQHNRSTSTHLSCSVYLCLLNSGLQSSW